MSVELCGKVKVLWGIIKIQKKCIRVAPKILSEMGTGIGHKQKTVRVVIIMERQGFAMSSQK